MVIENKPLTSIRGLAALWVVGLHTTLGTVSASKAMNMGYTAVDLFFILSGMILASVYSDLKPTQSGGFWLKRICRVYPAHISSLLILTAIVITPMSAAAFWGATANLPYAGSILLLQPYVHLQAAANPVAWSVGIEVGCYLIFPIAIFLTARLQPLRGAAICLPLLAFIEWEVCRHFGEHTHGGPAIARGVAGFGLGMMLWRVGSGIRLTPTWASLVEGIALVGVVLSIVVNRPDLIPLWSALLLFGLLFDTGLFAKILRSRWCLWLGNISFSIYLLHYPMALVVDRWLPVRPHFTPEEPIRIVAILAFTLGAATLSYHLVEKPGRRIPVLLRGLRPAQARTAATTG